MCARVCAQPADNQGVKAGLSPCLAVFLGLTGVISGRPVDTDVLELVMFAGSGGVILAAACAVAWHAAPKHRPRDELQSTLATAMPEWRAGRRAGIEAMVAMFAGPQATAHAIRCAALAASLAEQLSLHAEEIADISLAAALHVIPVAFPDHEDGLADGCAFGATAIAAAAEVLERTAPPAVARMVSEIGERWDGTGVPNRIAGDECSPGGRVVASVCAFDHASKEGLKAGIDAVRAGSGSAFDPVVAAELIHLFRESWETRMAA